MSIRVVIIDSRRPNSKDTFAELAAAEPIEILGIFFFTKEITRAIADLNPDVVLVHIGFSGNYGTNTIKKLKDIFPDSSILVYSRFRSKKDLFAALKAGAEGYILNSSTTEEMVSAIVSIYRGGSPISPEVTRYLVDHFNKSKQHLPKVETPLSNRETDILLGLADGLTSTKIASRLFLSAHTVRTHIKNIYEKLQVHSKVEAVMKAKDEGML